MTGDTRTDSSKQWCQNNKGVRQSRSRRRLRYRTRGLELYPVWYDERNVVDVVAMTSREHHVCLPFALSAFPGFCFQRGFPSRHKSCFLSGG